MADRKKRTDLIDDFVARIIKFGRGINKSKNNDKNPVKQHQRFSEPETFHISRNIPTSPSLSQSSNSFDSKIIKETVTIRSETTIRVPIKESRETNAAAQENQDKNILIEETKHDHKNEKTPLGKSISIVSGFSTEEEELITEKFNQLTKNGLLTKTQFAELYNDLRTEDPERLEKITQVIYNAFDTNKDGVISLEEFLRGYTITNHANLKKKLLFLFDLYDRNNSGYLNNNDITYVIEAMISLLDAELDLNADKIAEECFRDLDANNDGKVSKEEFVNGLQKNYALRSLMSPFN